MSYSKLSFTYYDTIQQVLHTMEGSKWISKERWIYGGKEKTAKYVREVANDQITVVSITWIIEINSYNFYNNFIYVFFFQNMYVDDVVSVQRYTRIR